MFVPTTLADAGKDAPFTVTALVDPPIKEVTPFTVASKDGVE
jgi:hypothetical protein